jgi:hypothetical protein
MTRHPFIALMLCAFSAVALAGPEAPGIDLPPRAGLIGALFTSPPGNPHVLQVASVLAVSPAFRRLHAGDTILSIDGRPVRDAIAAQKLLRSAVAGQELHLQVQGAHTAKVISLTVAPLTPEWERKLAAAEEHMRNGIKVEGQLAFLPQPLCYSGGGGEFLGLWALAGLGTAAAVESVQPDCRETFEACAPLTLLGQDDRETRLRAGGRKYRLAGDWRPLTFDTEEACRIAVSSGARAAGSSSPSPTWSAASQ